MAQGYSDTLCSLSVLRTDHPHFPLERRRPHVEPFAAHPLTDGTSLISRDALLDAMEDDDDIEWSENPFDRPHRAKPESPDAFLAMIQFESTTALQQALRTLCREFIDIFSTVVRPLPAKVMSMVIDIDRSKWELPSNRLTASRHFTAFMTMGGLYQWNRVAMGLKGAGPYFQRSMSNTVLAGLVSQICELYIDDVLIHGRDIETFLANVRKVFERLKQSSGLLRWNTKVALSRQQGFPSRRKRG